MANPPKWYRGFTCDEIDPGTPCRDFTPSYELQSNTEEKRFNEYERLVKSCADAKDQQDWETFVALQCKREAHLYIPGGRSGQRYVDVAYPIQPCRGGPGRNYPTSGISGQSEPNESTKTRWEEYGEDLSRRTQAYGLHYATQNPKSLARDNAGRKDLDDDDDDYPEDSYEDEEPQEELEFYGPLQREPQRTCRKSERYEVQIERALEAWGKLQHPTKEWPFENELIAIPDTPDVLISLGMPPLAAAILTRRRYQSFTAKPLQKIGSIATEIRKALPNLLVQGETLRSGPRQVIQRIAVDGQNVATKASIAADIRQFKEDLAQANSTIGVELNDDKIVSRVFAIQRPEGLIPSPFEGRVRPNERFVSLSVPAEQRLLLADEVNFASDFTEFVRFIEPGTTVILTVLGLAGERKLEGTVVEGSPRRGLSKAVSDEQLRSFVSKFLQDLSSIVDRQGRRIFDTAEKVVFSLVDASLSSAQIAQVEITVPKREHSILKGKRGKAVARDYRTLDGIDLVDLPEVLARMMRRKIHHRTTERKLKNMSSMKSKALENPDLAEKGLWGMTYDELKEFVKKNGPVLSVPWNPTKVIYYSEKRDKLIETTKKRAATWISFKKAYDDQGYPITPRQPGPDVCLECVEAHRTHKKEGGSSPPIQPQPQKVAANPYVRENPMNQADLAVLARAHELAAHNDDLGDVLKTAWDEIHLGVKANPRRRSRAATAKQKAARAHNRKVLKHAHALLRKSPRMSLKSAVDRAHAALSGKRSRRNPVDYTDTTMVRSALSQAVDYDDPSMIRSALVNPDTTMVRSALSRAVDYDDPTMIRSALMNPGEFRLGGDYSSHHPNYEQFDAQFSTSEEWSHGIQPMNRRNPRKSRKAKAARLNPIGEFRLGGDYSEHHPVYEQFDAQFSTGEDWSHGIQPMNRRNPMTSRQEAFANPRSGHQANAAEAMSLFRSGQASSLKEAWAMVKGESAAPSRRRSSRKSRHNPNFQIAHFDMMCEDCGGTIPQGDSLIRTNSGYAHTNCR